MTRTRRIVSLRWIITGAAIALTSASVIGVGVLAERNARRTLGQQLRTRVLLEARNLALTSSGADRRASMVAVWRTGSLLVFISG